MNERFEVVLLDEAQAFVNELDLKARQKIIKNFSYASMGLNQELFKKLTRTIWEFRTHYNGKYYRLFAFWDKGGVKTTLVVVTHGLVNKTNKVPIGDLSKAERIMIKYFNSKIEA